MRSRVQFAAVGFTMVLCAGAALCSAAEKLTRAQLLADTHAAELVQLPTPGNAIALPDDWDKSDAPVSIQLSQSPPGELSIRRVGGTDGRLYLEIRPAKGKLSGVVNVT